MKLTFTIEELNQIASALLERKGLDKNLISLKVYEEDDQLVGVTTSKYFVSNILGLFGSDSYIKLRVEQVKGNDIYLKMCNSLIFAAKLFERFTSFGIASVRNDMVIIHLEAFEELKPYLPLFSIQSIRFPGVSVEIDGTLSISAQSGKC